MPMSPVCASDKITILQCAAHPRRHGFLSQIQMCQSGHHPFFVKLKYLLLKSSGPIHNLIKLFCFLFLFLFCHVKPSSRFCFLTLSFIANCMPSFSACFCCFIQLQLCQSVTSVPFYPNLAHILSHFLHRPHTTSRISKSNLP